MCIRDRFGKCREEDRSVHPGQTVHVDLLDSRIHRHTADCRIAVSYKHLTAKMLSERFGKVLQKRQSMTINRNDKSTSISTQMDSLIPASKLSLIHI